MEAFPASHRFYGREFVDLEAIPAPGYYFNNWSGDLTGTENPVSVNVTHDSLIVANFSPIVHTLSLEVDGSGSIQPAAGAYQYNEGEVVTIKAVPNQGWQFDGWSGGVTNPDLTTTTVTVSSDKTVTAEFTPIVHNLSLGVDGSGSTKPVVGTHRYREGDVVTVIAITGEGWRFDGWSGDVTNSESAVTTVTVSSNKTVTANFTPIVHTLSLGVDGIGSIQPAAGAHEYNEGDVVTITATPGEGWQFDGWSGDVADSKSAVTTVTVSSDETVTANFTPIVHTLSLGVDGIGSVQPAAGTHDYNEGDVVTITATPGEGWQFDGWSGDVADSKSAVTIVTVSSDKTVTANFSQAEPSWWRALHTIYDKAMAMFRSLGD
ncbi:MAG: InlB B-repeat-containing protein [Dehalococcoidales bacterium]|nr:InlB B-repeat-containing protein [Dehalococcoidales bacterium]